MTITSNQDGSVSILLSKDDVEALREGKDVARVDRADRPQDADGVFLVRLEEVSVRSLAIGQHVVDEDGDVLRKAGHPGSFIVVRDTDPEEVGKQVEVRGDKMLSPCPLWLLDRLSISRQGLPEPSLWFLD